MINFLFNTLFFLIPLVFFKNTSELFEFNKIIVLYTFTTLITASWIIESIKQRKFLFKKTILDWPLVVYLSLLLISTLLSIDPRTSIFGYYSRFNGGLISQVCYAFLYWAYVSNIDKNKAVNSIFYILASTAIASLLATLEHFGIFTTCGVMGFGWKTSCWIQDVQNRVFSTLGQPNWLAAMLVTLMPVTWQIVLQDKKWTRIVGSLAFVLFLLTLIFTKSRSGYLALGVSALIFWGFIFWKEKTKYIKEFLVISSLSTLLFLVFNSSLLIHKEAVAPVGPALETGGTESGTIRKYVWLGAFEVFKHYPILGSGPETFAFSFPMYKPVGHNLTSEWDFIYNKAHNEFLNYLATTGILGFLSYLSVICFSIILIFKSKRYEYLAGYVAILITNFFGFSVVSVSLLSFIFPAIALVQSENTKIHLNKTKLKILEKLSIFAVYCIMVLVLYFIYRYWSADIAYNKARSLNKSYKQDQAITEINKALKFSPKEAVYLSELALADTKVETALDALALSPYNQNIRKILISNLVKNSDKSPDNLLLAEKVILDGTQKSPNDPKLYYQLGILQLKIGKNDEAIKNLKMSIQLKPNYKEGHYALGMTYKALKDNENAKVQLEYILKNIDPNDELTKKNLEELN
jgi:O-antigen ligase